MRHISAFAGIFLALVLLGTGVAFSAKNTLQLTKNTFYELGKNPGYIPTGNGIRPLLLGFDHFISDLYWLRAVQYAGSNTGEFQFNALPKYINLVTDLDPHFLHPYHFGALVYTLNDNIMDDVVPLLQKGIRENQGRKGLGRIYVDLAYFTYFYLEEYQKAAELYDVCAEQIADCPKYAAKTADSLRARTGKYTIALTRWMNRYAESITNNESEDEIHIAEMRVEEAAKMVALGCAVKNYTLSGKKIEKIDDLIGQSVFPCPEFSSVINKYISEKADAYGLTTISQETITSPFQNTPFEWNTKKNRVTSGRYWQ